VQQMKKQAWLYLNLGILSILLLGWMENSAVAIDDKLVSPINGSCTNANIITFRVEISSGKEQVKTVRFFLG
jgi:hypothetical protein